MPANFYPRMCLCKEVYQNSVASNITIFDRVIAVIWSYKKNIKAILQDYNITPKFFAQQRSNVCRRLVVCGSFIIPAKSLNTRLWKKQIFC
jgi:hypothetical protein